VFPQSANDGDREDKEKGAEHKGCAMISTEEKAEERKMKRIK